MGINWCTRIENSTQLALPYMSTKTELFCSFPCGYFIMGSKCIIELVVI